MHSRSRSPLRPTVYPSQVDLWIAVMLMFPPILTGGLGLYMLMEGNQKDAAILFGTCLLIGLISAAFTLPCRYTIEDEWLRIRCGIIGYKFRLKEIERVEKSGSWLSAPALSLKRVLITTKTRSCLVSPRERDAFIDDLQCAVEQVRSGNGGD